MIFGTSLALFFWLILGSANDMPVKPIIARICAFPGDIKAHGFLKMACLMTFFFILHSLTFSQAVIFKGTIKDEQTLKPIPDVNIKVNGTTFGTSTDYAGNFSLKINKIPTTLLFTCVGYETASYIVTEAPKNLIEFQLRPKSYMLREVDISSKKYSFLFKDNDYSVLDYELLGDHVLLLVFKYQLKQSELILLDRNGDTLAFSPLPEVPPASLFKDFLSNVHYISKAATAYQCLYNEQDNRIQFYPGKQVDSLQAYVKPFIFKMSDRLYFQEQTATGFGTAFGYYQKGKGKKYIRRVINKKKITEYIDDQSFYQNWNYIIPTERYFLEASEYNEPVDFDFTKGFSSNKHYEENEARAHQFEFYKTIFPVIKTGDDTIAFFNFVTDSLELMDKEGTVKSAVPIAFHKKFKATADASGSVKLSNPDWRWGSTVITDDFSREVYTLFLKNGMVKVHRIDLETGTLRGGTVLPFAFPEKIEIYKGEAYFLVKRDGSNDKWKLVKCKI